MDERKATVYTCVAEFYIVVSLNHNTIINLMVKHDNHGYRGKTMKKPWFYDGNHGLTMV